MAKTSSMTVIDPELANAPVLSKWQAEFNRAVADLGKFWSDGNAINIDVSWLLSHQHKNIEALTAASECAFPDRFTRFSSGFAGPGRQEAFFNHILGHRRVGIEMGHQSVVDD